MPTDIGTEVGRVVRAPGGPQGVGDGLRGVNLQILKAAEGAGVNELEKSGAPVALRVLETAVAAIVAAIGGFLDLPIVIIVLGLLLILVILEAILVHIAHLFPWGGTAIENWIHHAFSPLDQMEAWVVNEAERVAGTIVHNFVIAVQQIVEITFPNTSHGTVITDKSAINTLQNEISKLQTQTYNLQHQVNRLNAAVFHAGTSPTDTSPTLAEQVHVLQGQVAGLTDGQGNLQQKQQALTSTVSAVEARVHTLESSLHSVRSVEIGWADVQQEMQTTVDRLSVTVGHQGAELHSDTQNIAMLLPLAVLLDAGPKGIQTLRVLEDDPCQCPRPLVGDPLAMALALLEG